MLVLMAVMAACRPPVTSTLDPVLDPEFTTSLEADRILADPLTERVLWTMFDPARATAADGAVGPNQRGYVSIRPQADGACLTLALGVARSDAALIERGQSLLDWVLAAQWEDGVFPERGGHDSHYQAVSLMALTNLYLYTSESGHRQALYPALLAGYEWEATRISASGHIDDTGNTRTAHDPAVSPENKRINPREVALTLVYLSHLGPAFSEPHDLGEAVLSDFARQSGD